jgi:CDP-4-dehydro-6-deoxyglucose reductase
MKVQTLENKSFEVTSELTVLDSALNAGLIFEYSCKSGQCGVCKATLIEGTVEELRPQLSLTDSDIRANKILTCCCTPSTDIVIDSVELSALKDIEAKTIPARINQLYFHTENLVEVILRVPPTAKFKFLEGQYLDVILGETRRSYSIASTKSDPHIKLLIKKYPGGKMSDYWFNQAKENDLLRIEGPKGTFFLRDPEQDLIFLATGSGIAPIISMLNALDKDNDFIQKYKISIYWGNRTEKEFIWNPSFDRLDVTFKRVSSQPDEKWSEEKGYVQDVCLQHNKHFGEVAVYACGSNAMIQSAKDKMIKAGLTESQFYSDAFVQSF